MLIEILLALLLGVAAGTFTGLTPGIHINLVALMLFIYSGTLLQLTSPIVLAVFIVSMSITHTFLDFIPSIFLGAPEESTALSVLPGHSLLLKGRGYEAARLTVTGSYVGLLLIVILTPIFLFALPLIYEPSKKFIPFILIAASSFLIFREEKGKRIFALFLFLISGILGIFTLNFYMIKEPLFPLLTGLFGTSMLILSIKNRTAVPKQTLDCNKLDKKDVSTAIKSSVISAPLCSFLPGLGASQAAVLGSSFSKKMDERKFLVLLGIIGTLVAGLNFISLYAIGKGRSGTAVIIGKLIELDLNSTILLIAAMIVAGSIAVLLALYFARLFSMHIAKVDYQRLSIVILSFLVILSVVFSGFWSLVVLVTATSLGILASEFGIKKMHLMGCLILPVIFWLLL